VTGELVSVVIFSFVITALATPGLFAVSDRLYQRLRSLLDLVGIRSRGAQPEAETTRPPRIVLLGFHRVASALLAHLERTQKDLLADTLVVDINSATHPELKRRGVRVVYGDLASVEVLEHAGAAAAEVIVSSVPDELLKGTSNEALVRQLRALAPNAIIIATATTLTQVAKARAAGADHVFHAATEVALGVVPAVFAALDGRLPSFIDARIDEHGSLEPRVHVID
jgi:voltage-gated potassium channel Kch